MKTPYADLIVGFQEALEEYGKASEGFGVAKYRRARDCGEAINKTRDAQHASKVAALQKFNEVLTDLQELREGKVTRVGKPRSKRCCFCGNLEVATEAHRVTMNGARKWTCDECWDERLRD